MQYAALIRGIGPGNPNMKNEKLKEAFELAGMTDVHPIISSGNLIFESKLKDPKKIESAIEKVLVNKLGLTKNFVIVWSKDELEKLVNSNPFKGKDHGKEFYLLITFFKDRTKVKGGYIASAFETDSMDGPEVMQGLEKRHGKEITSRTWKTVERITAKFE